MIGLNKIGLNQVQLNQLYLNTLCAYQKSSGGDGFPRLPGDVTRWSFKGLTNEQMSKNPRLEDADHKGRFLTFKNFAWGEMSGVGGYTQNYNNSAYWKLALDRAETTKTGHSFNVTSVTSTVVAFYYQSRRDQEPFTVKSQIVRVSGLTDGQSIKYKTGAKSVLVIESDGIYTLPPFDFAAKGTWYGFSFGKIQESCNITLEQLPYYPGFIIGDGVDDYAVTEKNLDFEDTYTVYTAFIPFQEDPARNMVLCGKSNLKDFYMNYSTLNSINFYSSSKAATVKLSKGFNLIICKRTTDKMIIKNLLANVSIEIDANAVSENPGLYYLWRSLNNATYANAAIAGQVICNGHFTTDEEDTKVLNWYKKEYPWLFFDQAWTVTGKTNEDTDRATIANITGNGNNLVLSNFGFAGNSGYGEYAYNWNTWRINKVDSTKSNIYHNRMEITLPAIGESLHTQCNFYSPLCEVGTIYDFSFKISGLTDNSTVFVKPGTNGGGAIIAQYNKDGVYHLNYTLTDEAIIDESTQNRIYFFVQNFSDEEMNLTVEQIPDHQGYLVTDGVDDIVASSSFELDKKFTVVGEWKFINNESKRAGIVFPSKLYAYNEKENMLVYINTPITGNTLQNIRSFKTLTSDGKLYDNNWEERVLKVGDTGLIRNTITFGGFIQNSAFTQIAFKNLGIYNNQILSKEDMIKAYIYLQTLKAK